MIVRIRADIREHLNRNGGKSFVRRYRMDIFGNRMNMYVRLCKRISRHVMRGFLNRMKRCRLKEMGERRVRPKL